MASGTDWKAVKLNAMYGSARCAAAPATVYVAAYSDAPDADGGGTELAYAGYARIAVANTDTNFPSTAVGDNEKTNGVNFTFPQPAVDTDQIVAVAIHAHPTNDDIIDFETLPNPVSGAANQPLLIEAGALILSVN